MPEQHSYNYALIRIVPRVERGEYINAGVILYCPTQRFLGAETHLDEPRLMALAPSIDLETVRGQLEAIMLISLGRLEAGRIGGMSLSERFHWLVSPRSTIIQISPVHSGLSCEHDLQTTLRQLMQTMVYL